MGIPADVALGEEQIGIGLQKRQQMLADIILIRFSLQVQSHEVQRRQQKHLHALLLQIQLHHLGGQQFSLRQYHLLLHRAEELPGEGPQSVKDKTDVRTALLPGLFRSIKLLKGLLVFGFQAGNGVLGAVGIAVIQISNNFLQGIGGARHGG